MRNSQNDKSNKHSKEYISARDTSEFENIYRELKEKSLDGYARTDMEGRFLEVNKALQEMIGYTEKELLSLTYKDITPIKWHDKEVILMNKMLQNGYTALYEKEYFRKDGLIVPVEIRSYLIKDKNGNPVGKWAFVRDITIRKKIETKNKESSKKLEESNNALKEFVYFASHDLREPLRKIKTFGNMLVQRIGKDLDETEKDYLNRMINASGRMEHLLNELLKYSRVSNQALKLVPVDLNKIVRNAVSNLETTIEKRKCMLKLDNLPTVNGDATRLLQLFQNLLANAMKFQTESSIPQIHVGSSYNKKEDPNDAYFEIFVQDNGIGIDEKHLEEIFSPFHKLHSRMEYEGAGMGLAICKKIVDQHGGIIFAKNNLDQGATIIIRLPIRDKAGQG